MLHNQIDHQFAPTDVEAAFRYDVLKGLSEPRAIAGGTEMPKTR